MEVETLSPTYTPAGISVENQIGLMRELQAASSALEDASRRRNELIHALSISGSLSRKDMGRATNLSKSRIDQIIVEEFDRTRAGQIRRANEVVRRHTQFEIT